MSQCFENGDDFLSRCARLLEVTEGSLKWYTDFPPVLDRFKKSIFTRHFGEVKVFFGVIELVLFLFSGKLDGGRVEFSLFVF